MPTTAQPEFKIITDGENILRMQVSNNNDVNIDHLSECLHSYFCTSVQCRQNKTKNKYVFYTPERLCKMPIGAEELYKDRRGIEQALKPVNGFNFHVTWKIDTRAVELLQLRKQIFKTRNELIIVMKDQRNSLKKLSASLHEAGPLQRGQLQNEINNVILPLLRVNRERLKGIEAAIERIAQNTFGTCTVCQEEIPIDRLKSVPATPFCVDCCS